MVKQKAVQLLHTYGSGLEGDQWEWSAELKRDADAQVSLALIPTVEEGVEVDGPDAEAIESGGGLFDQLTRLWSGYVYEDISEADWKEIASKVTKFDKALARGLKTRLREEFDEQPEKPPAVAELWAKRATWESTTFVGRAVGYVPQEGFRRAAAVLKFVKDYQEQNGELPKGLHLIQMDNTPDFRATFPDGEGLHHG